MFKSWHVVKALGIAEASSSCPTQRLAIAIVSGDYCVNVDPSESNSVWAYGAYAAQKRLSVHKGSDAR